MTYAMARHEQYLRLEGDMDMNIKALITTLVLGSSSMASADSLTFSGSVSVSVGGSASTRPTPRPLPAPVYGNAHFVGDGCDSHTGYTPVPSHTGYAPVPSRPVVYAPVPQPTWHRPYFNITNTTVSGSGSVSQGSLGVSNVKAVNRFGYVRTSHLNQQWFDLTEATRIDSNRQFFKIGADNGLFKGLKLQALGTGRSRIEQVAIEYIDDLGNKKTQKVRLETWLDRNNAAITIDLEGGYRAIGRIIVYGATDNGAAYKIMAI
jgi:hypothetical protein